MRQATYSYDVVGNRTAVVDYNGHATYFTYDALNRLASEGEAVESEGANVGRVKRGCR